MNYYRALDPRQRWHHIVTLLMTLRSHMRELNQRRTILLENHCYY